MLQNKDLERLRKQIKQKDEAGLGKDVLELYKLLVDNGYPVQSNIRKTIEKYMMIEEALAIDPKYLSDADIVRKAKAEMLITLAYINYSNDEPCPEEELDYEKDKKDEVDHEGELKFRAEITLKLLKEANKIFKSPETTCFIGEIYLDIKDHEKAEEYFNNSLKLNKEYSRAYGNLGKLISMKEDRDAAISFLEQKISEGVGKEGISLVLSELYKEKAKVAKNRQERKHYSALAKKLEFGSL